MDVDIDSTLEKFGEEDVISTLLRYGLFLGAIIQLALIGAAIFLPYQESPDNDVCIGEEQKQSSEMINAARRQHKIRKLEKKKRR